MTQYVGKYNIDLEGRSYDEGIPYEMVIIEEFNGNKPVPESKKTLYFRIDGIYLLPDFKDEADVVSWLRYPNNARIQIYNKTMVEVVGRKHVKAAQEIEEPEL